MRAWTGVYRTLTRDEIMRAIADDAWQSVRLSMKGVRTEDKLIICDGYLESAAAQIDMNAAEVRVINYLNALKRGGQLNDRLEVVK